MPKDNLLKKLGRYLRDSKEETKKITWPSRKDTVRYSILTIILTLLTAAYFGGLDFIFSRILDWILS